MITRSAKAAERGQRIFSFKVPDTSPDTSPDTNDRRRDRFPDTNDFEKQRRRQSKSESKRKKPDVDDLEEERARPSKYDYNQVRKALILARSEAERKDAVLERKDDALEEMKKEMEGRERIMKDTEDQLLKCREVHRQIREIQDAVGVLRPMDHGSAGRTVRCGGQLLPSAVRATGATPEPMVSVKDFAMTLRTSIRDYANNYFGGKLQQASTAQLGAGWAHQYMQATTPGQETYMDYLRSRHRCPMIIEAFIWRFLCGQVFNGVPWGGSESIRCHMRGLQELLASFHDSPHSKPEQMRTYQQWRRQTTEMVLQIHNANTTPADCHLQELQGSFSSAISEVIVPFMRSSPVGHEDDLNQIIREAIELDMEMSRQLPRYSWRFSTRLVETPFNFSLGLDHVMRLHSDEKTASKVSANMEARVYLVVAPGLTARGLSNIPSTPFEEEYWVVPMEVTCVRPKQQKKFCQTNYGSDTTVD